MSEETSFRVVFRLIEKALQSYPPIFKPPPVYILAQSDFTLVFVKILPTFHCSLEKYQFF